MLFSNIARRFLATGALPKVKELKPPMGMQGHTAYVHYVKEQMNLKSASEDVTERMKQIAKQWNALNATQKKKYENLAKEEKENKVEEFKKLSQKEKEEAVAKEKETRKERAKRRERKERRENWEATKHPEMPPNAMALFVKEQFELRKKNNEPTTPVAQFMKEFAAQWKALSEENKKKYLDKSQQLRDAYKTAVDEWKKKQAETAKAEKA